MPRNTKQHKATSTNLYKSILNWFLNCVLHGNRLGSRFGTGLGSSAPPWLTEQHILNRTCRNGSAYMSCFAVFSNCQVAQFVSCFKCCREALPLVLASLALYSARRSSSKPTDFNHCRRESSAMSKCHYLSPQLRGLQSPPPNLSWEGTSTASSTLNHSIIAFWNIFTCARSYSMSVLWIQTVHSTPIALSLQK